MTQEPYVRSQKEVDATIAMAKALRCKVLVRLTQRLFRSINISRLRGRFRGQLRGYSKRIRTQSI